MILFYTLYTQIQNKGGGEYVRWNEERVPGTQGSAEGSSQPQPHSVNEAFEGLETNTKGFGAGGL